MCEIAWEALRDHQQVIPCDAHGPRNCVAVCSVCLGKARIEHDHLDLAIKALRVARPAVEILAKMTDLDLDLEKSVPKYPDMAKRLLAIDSALTELETI